MGTGRKYASAGVVGLLGVVAISVPALDMAQDVFAEGKPPLSTVVENSPLLVLALSILGAGVWLATSDWGPTYTWTVAKISAANAVAVAVLISVVVLAQARLQMDLKPFVIAADAVVIGIIGGVGLGIRTAQQEQATDEAATQRDRFQALFDNVPNPIVGVEFVGNVPVVRAVNPAFTEVFGFDRRTIVDESLEDYIVPPDQDIDPVDRPLSPQAPGDDDAWDSDVIELETVDGRREFIRLTAPVERGPERDGYAIYIDVTVQRQRRERLRVLSRTLRHDMRNKLNIIQGVEPTLDELEGDSRRRVEMAAEAADELLALSEQTRQVEQQIAGDSTPRRQDMADIVSEQADAARSAHPGATVTVSGPESAHGRATDAVSAAIGGLIRNGIQHNDQSDPVVDITIAESLDGEYLGVRIADNGPGISPEEAEIAEGKLTPDQKTSHLDGLGLWTARWVMQNSGGRLEFSANSPRGTIATLRIPTADADTG